MSGNLPPGAANDPNAPWNQPDHSHEHEWLAEDMDVEHDEYVYFHQSCSFAETYSVGHSERLDETFYETGWECEATRTITYGVDWDRFPFDYDREPTHWDMCYYEARQRLLETVNWWGDDFPEEVTVFVQMPREEHEVKFLLDGVSVYEY